MASPSVDLDFQRYVRSRRGALDAQAREGAAYAYPGDVKVLRTLAHARPVRMALGVAARLARSSKGDSSLGPAIDESTRTRLAAALGRAAELLHLRKPRLLLAPSDQAGVCTVIGSEEDPVVLVSPSLAAPLGELELLHLAGSALGAVQNQHVPYTAVLHHLERDAAHFVAWIIAPARAALRSWSRRAVVTRDRAGLLCSRSLDASLAAIDKTSSDENERRRRKTALGLFAESRFFRATVGLPDGSTMEQCNARTAEALSR